eukprot:scpid82935/ scgid20108/ 
MEGIIEKGNEEQVRQNRFRTVVERLGKQLGVQEQDPLTVASENMGRTRKRGNTIAGNGFLTNILKPLVKIGKKTASDIVRKGGNAALDHVKKHGIPTDLKKAKKTIAAMAKGAQGTKGSRRSTKASGKKGKGAKGKKTKKDTAAAGKKLLMDFVKTM